MRVAGFKRLLLTGAAVATLVASVAPASAADNRGAVQGVVGNAAGQPVTGAFVKL